MSNPTETSNDFVINDDNSEVADTVTAVVNPNELADKDESEFAEKDESLTDEDVVRRYNELTEIANELKETELVDKATRVALESYDDRGMLPHANGYTAAPSKVNYDETVRFVNSVKVNVGKLSATTLKDSCHKRLKEMEEKLDKVKDLSEVVARLQQFNKSKNSVMAIKAPTGPVEALDNEELDRAIENVKEAVDYPHDLSAELDKLKSPFHIGNDIGSNLLCINRFYKKLFSILLHGTLGHMASILADGPGEVHKAVEELISKLREFHNPPVDRFGDTNFILTRMYSNNSIVLKDFDVDVQLATEYLHSATVDALWRTENTFMDSTDIPSTLRNLLKSIGETILALQEEGDDDQEEAALVQNWDERKKAIKDIEPAIETYVDTTKMFTDFLELAIEFNDEFVKSMDLVVREAKRINEEES